MRSLFRAFPSALALSIVGVAACGPSPGSERPRAMVDVPLAAEGRTIDGVVPANATFQTLFSREHLPGDVSIQLVEAIGGVFNPRNLRANRAYHLTRSLDGLLREFRYDIDPDRFLRVVLRAGTSPAAPAGTFDATVVAVPKAFAPAAISVSITREHNSLVGAFAATGENVQLPLQLAQIFGGELDFNTDLQQGDRFDVLFDRAVRDGAFAGYGDVRAASLVSGGRAITAVRFVDGQGAAGWYDEQGRSLRRQFLSSPLPFDPRVTSSFSTHREHPVYGGVRPHLGVDYGAPYGTAVNAVASGVVEVADWAGDAGRMVRLRHAGGYETAYLHMSSFAPGVRAGARVEQGQIIGRVGQTGAATGPHLDYRIIKNGTYVDPVAQLRKMPPGVLLDSAELSAFFHRRDETLTELRTRLAR